MSGNVLNFLLGRRKTVDRREEQRDMSDRRKMVGVKTTVRQPTDFVEFWLRKHCTHAFEVVEIDVSDDLECRDIEVMFHDVSDRDMFEAKTGQF